MLREVLKGIEVLRRILSVINEELIDVLLGKEFLEEGIIKDKRKKG